MLKTNALVAFISYLLGSIPFGYILVKLFRKQDIRESGSGNIGATNVARSGAKGLAVATLLLDAGKGYLAVQIASMMPWNDFLLNLDRIANYQTRTTAAWAPNSTLMAVGALFAILGHVFTVWLKFRGGKGVATGLGAFLALAPKTIVICFVVFLVVVAITRYISLGSILSAAIFPIATYWLYPEVRALPISIMLSTASMLIIIKHHDNIRRLIAGTEHRLGHSKNGLSNDDGEDNG